MTDEVVEKVALIVGDKLGGHDGLGEVYRRNGDVRWQQSLEISQAALDATPLVKLREALEAARPFVEHAVSVVRHAASLNAPGADQLLAEDEAVLAKIDEALSSNPSGEEPK